MVFSLRKNSIQESAICWVNNMKTAASVFSWIGGLLTAVIYWVSFGILASQSNTAFLIIPALYTIVDLVILIWRQVAVEDGNKVGSGVFTLIFCSTVGGILTLCIPESQLRGSASSSSYSTSTNYASSTPSYPSVTYKSVPKTSSTPQASQKAPSEKEKIELVREYKKLLDEGAITEEEFAKKKKELLQI